MAEPLILEVDLRDKATPKFVRARDELGRFTKGLGTAQTGSQKLETRLGKLNFGLGKLSASFGRVRQAAFSLRGALVAVGAGLALRSSFNQIAAFDRAIGQTAAVARATKTEFEELSKAARDIGKDTQFTATQAAEGLNVLVRAGFDAKSSITVLRQAVAGATVAGTDLEGILRISTDALAIFQLEASDTGRVIDALTAADIKGKTSILELGDAIADVGTIFATIGIEIEEVGAALAILSNKGVTGSKAGRGLRTVFSQLLDPTKELALVIEEVGLTLDDFNPTVTKTSDILNNFGRFSPEQIARGFDVFASSTVSALAGTGDELNKLTEEIRSSSGVTQQLAGEISDDLVGAFARLKSSVSEVVLSLGDAGLRDIFRLTIDAVTELFRELGNNKDAFKGIRDFAGFVKDNYPALKSIFRTSVIAPIKAIGIAIKAIIVPISAVLKVLKAITNFGFKITGIDAAVESVEDLSILFRSFARVFPSAGALLERFFSTLEVVGKGAVNTLKKEFEDFVNNTINKVIKGLNLVIEGFNKITGANFDNINEISLGFNIDENFVGIENLDARFQEIRDKFQDRLREIDADFLNDTFKTVGERAGTEFGSKFIESAATQLANLEGSAQAAEFGRLSSILSPEEFAEVLSKFSGIKEAAIATVKEAEVAAKGLSATIQTELGAIDASLQELKRNAQLDLQLGNVDLALAKGQITEIQAIQQKLQLETQFVLTQQESLRLEIEQAKAVGDVVTAKKLELELEKSKIELAKINQDAQISLAQKTTKATGTAVNNFSSLKDATKSFFSSFNTEADSTIDKVFELIEGIGKFLSLLSQNEGINIGGLFGGQGQQQGQQQTPQFTPPIADTRGPGAAVFETFLNLASTKFGEELPAKVEPGIDSVISKTGEGISGVGQIFGQGFTAIQGITQNGFSGIAQTISQIISSIGSKGGGTGGTGGAGGGIGGVFGAAGAGFSLGQLVGNLIRNGFQDGGRVAGTGRGDKVPALLEPGEFVLTRSETKALGLDKGPGQTVTPSRAGVERAAPAQNNIDVINFLDPSVFDSFVTRREGRETIVNMLKDEGVI